MSKIDYRRKNFINSAFTSTQRSAIKTTSVVNNNNTAITEQAVGTTSDKVFLLSISEVCSTLNIAAGYGFAKNIIQTMKREEADAVHMLMQWG
ncbi:MAG: DUF6273 domain-containing protein [Anaerobutyricum soehngenii]